MVSSNAEAQLQDAGAAALDPNQPTLNGTAGQGGEGAGTAPGAESGDGKPGEPAPQTFSQADIDKAVATAVGSIQSAKDKEVAQQRQTNVDLARRLQEQEAKAIEDVAAARDSRSVEDGDLTQTEADRRQAIRAETAKLNADLATGLGTLSQVRELNEAEARPLLANALEARCGFEPGTLLNDASLSNATLMLEKAETLWRGSQDAALTAREKAVADKEAPVETFDQSGGGSSSAAAGDAEARLRSRYPSMF